MTSKSCNEQLLKESLEEQLTEHAEELLTEHLACCRACRERLEELASGGTWREVAQVLRSDSSIVNVSQGNRESATRGPEHTSSEEELIRSGEVDFIVDYLKPGKTPQSLGRLGSIEIQKFIGRGAHGIVLKGLEDELQRLVAVKVMSPHLASVAAARQRFAREARAAAAIVHPNVMPILHVDSSGLLPFLVMPFVNCESLQERLDRSSPIPSLDALRIGVQIAKGLAAAHAQGLVHRDVKPANILLERGVERVMLTDFGLARAVDDATLTRSGLIAGTPHFMSPEQARGDTIDPRSDLFSFGSVMYTMLAGRPPFRAESTYGILRRVTDDVPRSLREIQPDVPAWLEGITMKLLSKEPDQRFADAELVAKLLEDCVAHLQQPTAIRLPEEVRQLQQSTMEQESKRFLLYSVGLACAALLVIGMWIYFTQPGSKKDQKTKTTAGTTIDPYESKETLKWETEFEAQLNEIESDIDQMMTDVLPVELNQ